MPSLQQTLFDVTQPLHQRIENNPFMTALVSGNPLEPSYRWLLSHLYSFAKGGEKKLIELLGNENEWDISKRCRCNLLENDLHDLNIIIPSDDISLFDTIKTKGNAIGLLYVMEGSRKGGAFLSALLENKEPHLPRQYLNGYAETSDFEWTRFLQTLEHYYHSSIQDDIVSGAIRSFEILEEIFNGTK